MLSVDSHHPLAGCIQSFQKFHGHLEGGRQLDGEVLDPKLSEGMNGYLGFGDCDTWPQTVISPIAGMPDLTENQVLSVSYRLPASHKHISKLADGVIIPEKTIKEQDLKVQPLHEEEGTKPVLERPPVPGSISGAQLSDAAHRLLVNNMEQKSNNVEQEPNISENALQILKRQAKQATIQSTSVGGIVGVPSPYQPPGPGHAFSPGKPPPAGPPGYERGFSPARTVASTGAIKGHGQPFVGRNYNGHVQLPPTNQVIALQQHSHPQFLHGFLSSQQTEVHQRQILHVPHGENFVRRGGGSHHIQQGPQLQQSSGQQVTNPHQFPYSSPFWGGKGDGNFQVSFFVRCRKMIR